MRALAASFIDLVETCKINSFLWYKLNDRGHNERERLQNYPFIQLPILPYINRNLLLEAGKR